MLTRGVRRDHNREAPGADCERGGKSPGNEAHTGTQGQTGSKRPAGHGSAPLDRVMLIGLRVDHVVDQVGARGHDAEHEESADHTERRVPVAQDAGSCRRHEHEDVLDPLPGAHSPGKQDDVRACPGGGEVTHERHDPSGARLAVWDAAHRGHGATADMVMKSRAHHVWK